MAGGQPQEPRAADGGRGERGHNVNAQAQARQERLVAYGIQTQDKELCRVHRTPQRGGLPRRRYGGQAAQGLVRIRRRRRGTRMGRQGVDGCVQDVQVAGGQERGGLS